ncbi:MAG TPA: YraN family protein [Anaerolineae bacterium]|nr:YraN family protein [Anaerolineae bacterium]HNU03403.1 YraN family protein [Anaerolineae bacterium]
MSAERQRLGRAGEQMATDLLAGKGYQILARNWRSGRSGEIDLVAQDGPCLVIVEVRTRRGRQFGSAEESVTPAKQARLAALAEAYSAEAGWQGPLRIDVVAISLTADGRLLETRHLMDVVG